MSEIFQELQEGNDVSWPEKEQYPEVMREMQKKLREMRKRGNVREMRNYANHIIFPSQEKNMCTLFHKTENICGKCAKKRGGVRSVAELNPKTDSLKLRNSTPPNLKLRCAPKKLSICPSPHTNPPSGYPITTLARERMNIWEIVRQIYLPHPKYKAPWIYIWVETPRPSRGALNLR